MAELDDLAPNRQPNKGDAMTKAPLSDYEATLRVKMISGVCALVQQMAIKAPFKLATNMRGDSGMGPRILLRD